jgi:hypothetical protein
VEFHHQERGFICQRHARLIYTLQDNNGEIVAGANFLSELSGPELQNLL